MSDPDALDFDRAADRIERILAVLGVVGLVAAAAWRGWPWGGGFLLGVMIAGLNFYWLRRMVERLGSDRPKGPRKAVLALRYLALAAIAYVIVRYSSVSVPAVFAGVFTLTAAVMIEAVIEIAYARK